MKKILTLTMAAACLMPTLTMAAASNKTGFKFGGSGFYYYNQAIDGAASLSSVNGGFGWSVFAGYRFNDLLGLRVGYHQLSNTDNKAGARGPGYGPDHYFLKAYDAVVTLNVPLGYCTDVTLKAGGAAVNQDVFNLTYSSDPLPEVDFKVTKILPELGVGFHFQHNRLLATEWTWTHIHGSEDIKNIDMLSFGLAFTIPV